MWSNLFLVGSLRAKSVLFSLVMLLLLHNRWNWRKKGTFLFFLLLLLFLFYSLNLAYTHIMRPCKYNFLYHNFFKLAWANHRNFTTNILLCKTCYLVGFSHWDIIRPSRQGENAGVSQIRNESIKCLCRDEQRPPTIQNCDLQWNSHTRVIAKTRSPRFFLLFACYEGIVHVFIMQQSASPHRKQRKRESVCPNIWKSTAGICP